MVALGNAAVKCDFSEWGTEGGGVEPQWLMSHSPV